MVKQSLWGIAATLILVACGGGSDNNSNEVLDQISEEPKILLRPTNATRLSVTSLNLTQLEQLSDPIELQLLSTDIISTDEYAYKADGDIEFLRTFNSSGETLLESQYSYTFADEYIDSRTQTTNFYTDGVPNSDFRTFTFNYEALTANLSSVTIRSRIGSNFTPIISFGGTVFEYEDNLQFGYETIGDDLILQSISELNENGSFTEIRQFDRNGNMVEVYTFYYDEYGRPLVDHRESASGEEAPDINLYYRINVDGTLYEIRIEETTESEFEQGVLLNVGILIREYEETDTCGPYGSLQANDYAFCEEFAEFPDEINIVPLPF